MCVWLMYLTLNFFASSFFNMGKFATRHRYFLVFAETQHSIVTLSGTITIPCHICQNTPPS
jgi:hypothetical protein